MAKKYFAIGFTKKGVILKDLVSAPKSETEPPYTIEVEHAPDEGTVLLYVDYVDGKKTMFDKSVKVVVEKGKKTEKNFSFKPLAKERKGEIMLFAPGKRPIAIPFQAGPTPMRLKARFMDEQPIDLCIWQLCDDYPFCEKQGGSQNNSDEINAPLAGQEQRYRALRQIALTNSILRQSNAGMYLRVAEPDDIVDLVSAAKANHTLLRRFSWGTVDRLNEQLSKVKDRHGKSYTYRYGYVNLFYTQELGRQFGCGQPGGDDIFREGFIVLSRHAMDDLLLHEFGHILGLSHTDEGPVSDVFQNIPVSNFMRARCIDRSSITIGQLARMNFGRYSIVNTLFQPNISRLRSCPDIAHNPQCPELYDPENDKETSTYKLKDGAHISRAISDPKATLPFSLCDYGAGAATLASEFSTRVTDVSKAVGMAFIDILGERADSIVAELKKSKQEHRYIWPSQNEVDTLIAMLESEEGKLAYIESESMRFFCRLKAWAKLRDVDVQVSEIIKRILNVFIRRQQALKNKGPKPVGASKGGSNSPKAGNTSKRSQRKTT